MEYIVYRSIVINVQPLGYCKMFIYYVDGEVMLVLQQQSQVDLKFIVFYNLDSHFYILFNTIVVKWTLSKGIRTALEFFKISMSINSNQSD